jgi:hypothetical protein
MTWLIWLLAIAFLAAILFLPIPNNLTPRKKKDKVRSHRVSRAVLVGLTEVFQPSASKSAEIVEAQRESRKPIPSPAAKHHSERKEKPQS